MATPPELFDLIFTGGPLLGWIAPDLDALASNPAVPESTLKKLREMAATEKPCFIARSIEKNRALALIDLLAIAGMHAEISQAGELRTWSSEDGLPMVERRLDERRHGIRSRRRRERPFSDLSDRRRGSRREDDSKQP